MATFLVASGVTLLYDEGVLPFNPAKQALESASPAEEATLRGEGFAMRRTAVAEAMDDDSGHGTTDLSPEAMQFLEQELTSAPAVAAPKAQTSEATLQPSGYPYAGWSSSYEPVPASTSSEPGIPAASTPINILA